ncbi:hypothetical protein TB2_043712 [Malus domestica]
MSMLLDTPSELDITSKFGSSENINFSNCKILTSNYHWWVANISQYMGKTVSATFYESFVSVPRVISSKEITTRLLKILETRYSSTVAIPFVLHLHALLE